MIHVTQHKPANLVAFAFLLIAFLTGIASAFQLPTLSLFLSKEIQVSPIMVGTFYSINAVIGIVVSQIVASYSDKQDDRRKVMMICCIAAVFGCLIFAYVRNYYLLVFFGTVLLGTGSAANPQTFAFAREYAESTQREAVMFTTILRTQISLAWIVGPPLSFMIVTNWGFGWMYVLAALAFLLCATFTYGLLPKISRKTARAAQSPQDAPRSNRKSTLYLFIVCFLGWTCNSIYLINMPLYIINDLHMEEKIAGILMGMAAGLEIPVMLLAGYLNRFFSKKQLMCTALFSGFLFYIGILFAEGTWQFIALQGLNAVFIGVIATVGMLYFQDLMPRQMGAATTLFANAAKSSWILGGPIAGFISQYWHYNTVFYVCVVSAIFSIILMRKVKSC